MEYFSRRSLACPQFTNPADFLLDILEEDALDDEDGADKRHQPNDEERGLLAEDDEYAQSFPLATPLEEGDPLAINGDALVTAYKESEESAQLRQRLEEEMGNVPHNNTNLGALQTRHKHKRRANFLDQIAILTHRTWLATSRDSKIMYVRTGAALGIALLVGGIFFQQVDTQSSAGNRINTLLFLMCVFSLFCLPEISRIVETRLLFLRERSAGAWDFICYELFIFVHSGYYNTFTYLIAMFLVEFPILLFTAVGYGCIAYWMVSHRCSVCVAYSALLSRWD